MAKFKYLILPFFLIIGHIANAQDNTGNEPIKSDLKKKIAFHKSQIDSLTSSLKLLEADDALKRKWDFGFGGLFGMDFNRFSNWAGRGEYHNSSAAAISMALSVESNLNAEDFFWKNSGKLTLGWQKQMTGEEENSDFHKTADIVNVHTHFGYKANKKLAASVLGAWKSNLLDQSLNPSYMDWSVGVTWTPDDHFAAVIHPANYEFALTEKDKFESSFGSKIVLEYDKDLDAGIQLKSNLAGFMSYEDIDFLTNYTWTNSLNIKILQNIGVGVEYALRISPQETLAIESDEDIQSYVVMGISYVLP